MRTDFSEYAEQNVKLCEIMQFHLMQTANVEKKCNMRQKKVPVNWYTVILSKFEQFNKSFIKVKPSLGRD